MDPKTICGKPDGNLKVFPDSSEESSFDAPSVVSPQSVTRPLAGKVVETKHASLFPPKRHFSHEHMFIQGSPSKVGRLEQPSTSSGSEDGKKPSISETVEKHECDSVDDEWLKNLFADNPVPGDVNIGDFDIDCDTDLADSFDPVSNACSAIRANELKSDEGKQELALTFYSNRYSAQRRKLVFELEEIIKENANLLGNAFTEMEMCPVSGSYHPAAFRLLSGTVTPQKSSVVGSLLWWLHKDRKKSDSDRKKKDSDGTECPWLQPNSQMTLVRTLMGTMKTQFGWEYRMGRDFNNNGGFRARMTNMFQERIKQFPGVSVMIASAVLPILTYFFPIRVTRVVSKSGLLQALIALHKLILHVLMRVFSWIIFRRFLLLSFSIGGYAGVRSQPISCRIKLRLDGLLILDIDMRDVDVLP